MGAEEVPSRGVRKARQAGATTERLHEVFGVSKATVFKYTSDIVPGFTPEVAAITQPSRPNSSGELPTVEKMREQEPPAGNGGSQPQTETEQSAANPVVKNPDRIAEPNGGAKSAVNAPSDLNSL